MQRLFRLNLFDLKRKIHRHVLTRDFDFVRLRAQFAVIGFDNIFAGRHIFDGEFAVLVADGKIRAVKNADPREHPRMHVALEFQKHFRLWKCVGQICAAGHLRVVMLGIAGSGNAVDIVNAIVGIFDDEFLAGLNRQNRRRIKTAFLIEHRGLGRRTGGFAGDFVSRSILERNDHIRKFAIFSDDIKMRRGRRGIHLPTSRVVHDGRDFHFLGRRAFERDGSRDVGRENESSRAKNSNRQK